MGCRQIEVSSGSLAERFPSELEVLKKLFQASEVESKLPRLEEIFTYTEAKWGEYVARLPGGRVNYLMVAEAPPWSEQGKPEYALDPLSKPRTFMRPLTRAFQTEARCGEEAITALAQRGFLLVDSSPFAMKYPSRKRKHQSYKDLIGLSATSYLQQKLRCSGLSFSTDLYIAFGIMRNAQAILSTLRFFNLGTSVHPLSAEMIAISGANYPSCERIRAVYRLD